MGNPLRLSLRDQEIGELWELRSKNRISAEELNIEIQHIEQEVTDIRAEMLSNGLGPLRHPYVTQ